MIEFPMPELTQRSDQSAMIAISAVVAPGFLAKNAAGNYVMRLQQDRAGTDLDSAEMVARAHFHELLGILRAKKHGRGELAIEVVRSPAWDEHGNVTVRVGTARAYVMFPGDLENFAAMAAHGMAESTGFRDALRIFGAPNRDAADFYKIYELAKKVLGGPDEINGKVGLSKARQKEFTKSANNLAPSEGGRHATNDPSKASMTLDGLSRFTTELMAGWIHTYAAE
jgi:hypothetical protein